MDNDQWQVFQRMIDDMPATAMVETSWTDEGPDPEKPVCAIIRIPFESEEELGFPDTDEEFEALDAMTDAFVEALHKHQAYFAGKLMHNFAHSLYFYTPDDDGVEQTVASVISKFKGREADVTCIDDPEWERIGEDVWPTDVEVRWNEDMSVLSSLEEEGDDMTTPREIEHMAIFPSRETSEQFAHWSRQNGFKVGEPAEAEENAYTIEFTKVSAPTIEAIFDQTGAITEAAEELGGMYDGWQCRLVKS